MADYTFQSLIRTIPNYPKKGIQFKDITPLLSDGNGFKQVIDQFVSIAKPLHLTKIAAIDARGFIIGGALANRLSIGFVPIRKKGKLPHRTFSASYALEYGTDCLEIHQDALTANDNVLIVDDLIATGGTAKAAIELIKHTPATITGFACIINLTQLGGNQQIKSLGYSTYSLITY